MIREHRTFLSVPLVFSCLGSRLDIQRNDWWPRGGNYYFLCSFIELYSTMWYFLGICCSRVELFDWFKVIWEIGCELNDYLLYLFVYMGNSDHPQTIDHHRQPVPLIKFTTKFDIEWSVELHSLEIFIYTSEIHSFWVNHMTIVYALMWNEILLLKRINSKAVQNVRGND